jgi:hypothetical protein
MEAGSRVLGEEYPDTLTSIANLAYTVKDQEYDSKAIEFL